MWWNQQIQSIPTPWVWVSFGLVRKLNETLHGRSGTPAAAAEFFDSVNRGVTEEGTIGLGGSPTAAFAEPTEVLDHGLETDAISGLAASPTPANVFMFVDGPNQSEAISGLAASPTPVNEFMFVDGPASSDAIAGLAGTPTPSASEP